MPHGPINPGNADLLNRLNDLEGASYAEATSTSTIVSGAVNTKGILVKLASLTGNNNSTVSELFYDDDGAGTNKRVLLRLAIDPGGGNNGPNGAGAAHGGFRVPPGKHLRCYFNTTDGGLAIHYEVQS